MSMDLFIKGREKTFVAFSMLLYESIKTEPEVPVLKYFPISLIEEFGEYHDDALPDAKSSITIDGEIYLSGEPLISIVSRMQEALR